MAEFQDLREFLDQPTLRMPIGGRVFEVKPVSAATWLRLQEMWQRWVKAGSEGSDLSPDDNINELDLYKIALSEPLYAEIADHATLPELKQAGITAFYWQIGEAGVAAAVWASGGKASEETTDAAVPPNSSTSTGAATTTRKRASTTTMTSRPKRKPTSTKRSGSGRNSPGTGSSTTGT